MNLRTRFNGIIGGAAFILAAGALSAGMALWQIRVAVEETDRAGGLLENLSLLKTLTFDYQNSPSARAKDQWLRQYHLIGTSIGDIRGIPAEVLEAWTNVRSLFERILRLSGSAPPVEEDPLLEELRRRYNSSLNVETQRVIDWARAIASDTKTRQTAVFRTYSILAAVMLSSFVLATGWILFTMEKHILHSISLLRIGAEAVAHGNLEHRVDLTGSDELGQLAGAFNSMTRDLHRLYAEMEHANRTLTIIGGCNQILVRSQDEAELLGEICRLIVSGGPYVFCWVGLTDAQGMMRVIASAGREEGYLMSAAYGRGLSPEEGEPVGHAVRQSKAVIVSDFGVGAPRPWKTEALRRGYATMIALPLGVGKDAVGCLAIFSGEAAAFNPHEQELLGALAADVAYGIQALRDRAGRDRAQEELSRAKEELERRYEALQKIDIIKEGLIRDVSHELKTPVAKQSMQIELLRARLGEECSGRVGKIIEVMEQSVRRQQEVIRNILDLSRLEAGGYRSQMMPCDIAEVLERVIEDYRQSFAEAGLRLEESLEHLTVAGDTAMLWHVFSNIVNNAVKFRNRERPGMVGVTVRRHGSEAVASIRDEGIGVEPEHLPHVFDRFYQAKATSEGTGVGLAICKRIVEEMKGSIVLESAGSGRGTTVTVRLPLMTSPVGGGAPIPGSPVDTTA